VLCKLVESREIASLGSIASSKAARFSCALLGPSQKWSGRASLDSSTEKLLARCAKTGSTEMHLVLLYGFPGVHVGFPDARPPGHPCSRFTTESVESIFRTSLPHLSFNLDEKQGFLLV